MFERKITSLGKLVDNIYPNPFEKGILVMLNNQPGADIVLQDMNGKVWYESHQGDTTQGHNLQHLPAGVYVVRVTAGEATEVEKLVKLH